MEKSLVLRVLTEAKACERVPVWAMRQAGRVLASYRKIRAETGDFKKMIQTPELATEITCLPIQDLEVDAAIVFSDILVVPEAMGFPYRMYEGKGPYLPQVIEDAEDVKKLLPISPKEQLKYVLDTLSLTRRALPSHVSVIGFSGAPWTLLAYLLEGGGSKTFTRARSFLYHEPSAAHEALDRITQAVIDYLIAQKASGADILQLFDTLAEILSPSLYKEFGLPYVQKISAAMQKADIPLIVFAKGAPLSHILALPCKGVSLDWHTEAHTARKQATPLGKVLQGQLDPALLYAPKERILQETHQLLQTMKDYPYIANLGHGLYPDIPEEHVRFWVKCVKAYPQKP